MTRLKELERLLGQGRIGRREFLARATAMGALAAVSPAILSGTAKAATPKKGGTIRFGMGHGSTTDWLWYSQSHNRDQQHR
jgi:peptide/nickel transport system substrate-binding protein